MHNCYLPSQGCFSMLMCQDSTCPWTKGYLSGFAFSQRFLASLSVETLLRGRFTPLPHSIFPLFYQCDGCLFLLPLCGGLIGGFPGFASHSSPWEWSPSSTLLSIIDGVGCLKHPTETLQGSCSLKVKGKIRFGSLF